MGICLVIITASFVCPGCVERESVFDARVPLCQAVYVWQRYWSPEVVDAVAQASSKASCFMVLAGEMERKGDALRYVKVLADWDVLGASHRGVWLVFRSCPGLTGPDRSPGDKLAQQINVTLAEAVRVGVSLDGIQLDYDCPTEELEAYANLLVGYQKAFPKIPLSITVLPTWLPYPDCRRVINASDHFVLQVHGVNRPVNREEPLVLCDTENIGKWMEQAARFKTPFHVALPTYGYRVFFDCTGAFTGIMAEERRQQALGWTHKEIHANPVELARVVKTLATTRSPYCRGVAWFRMPVTSDAFNWTWPTLEQVMTGKPPRTTMQTELRFPRENLCELWVQNRGDYTPPAILISVSGPLPGIRALDTVNGFQAQVLSEEERLEFRGPPPGFGDPVLAGWWVIKPQPGYSQTLSATTVEVFQ